jgi:hypothetical protein
MRLREFLSPAKVLWGFLVILFAASILVVDGSGNSNLVFTSRAYAVEKNNIALSGTGQQATKKFNLKSGLAVFTMKHTGSSNFAINLLDSSGESVDLLVNEIGSFSGKKALGIPADGQYLLDVTADGPWSVTISQSTPGSPESVPQTFSGKSQDVSPFFSVGEGLATFKMSHNGDSNFIITLLDSSGNDVELLVNEIGKFNGSKAIQIPTTGTYLLDIQANGPWTIKVSGEKPSAKDLAKSTNGDNGEDEGCFIATAAYGDPNAPDINKLRKFRDEKMLTNSEGRNLVNTYYRYGPVGAKFISKRPVARFLTKELLIRPVTNFVSLIS